MDNEKTKLDAQAIDNKPLLAEVATPLTEWEKKVAWAIWSGVYDKLTCKELRELFPKQ